MFLSNLKKTFENTKIIHRFIYENDSFFEDVVQIDQKNYNNLQIGVLKGIAELKFAGDINKFIKDPISIKIMAAYKEYVKQHLPFLLNSTNNPEFNPFDYKNVENATEFILNKLYHPKVATMSAKG